MRTIGTLLFLLTGTVSFSQSGGLKGQILDNGQYPFAGLTIRVLDGDSVVTWTTTDGNGDYKVENIKAGLYSLSIQHLGFKERVIKDVSITADEIRQFDINHPGPCTESLKICPKGHTDGLIPIIYGLPGKKLMKKAHKGQIRLGGCIVTDCDPKWYCKTHEIEF
jgi:hypothetical protein